MEENKTQKINFFKKVWYSVTKFEKYPDMAAEGLGNTIKYLAIMVAIVTVFITIGSLIEMNKLVGKLAIYIDENIPEFSYAEGKIDIDSTEPIVIENAQYTGIDKIVINTLIETDEQKEQVEKDNTMVGTTVFFFNDEIILKAQIENSETVRQAYTYSDFIFIHAISHTGMTSAISSKSRAESYSSGGGGFSSGGGGGGSFGGGGGGGGFR